ncbi:MAG: UDP-N-acetylmuramoyl-L-alanyl-D-glutamate--2,6-diaminopimelate ligase, partial [Sneathiella sp.]|nr:UDP-N-acetylmuramoyl-L-alanyl-D-glutamate--2,6-diaminopimelate ligase [Sneathiella sp.]
LKTENPRQKLAYLAARFCNGMPASIAAVTGTNGKTSVAHFTRMLWQNMGLKSASIGTLGIVTQEKTSPLHYTSPEPVLLHQTLKELQDVGITHVALEASSHGLDQFRLDAVKVKVAAFTNLTRDHLDYHENSEVYLKAKLGLVSRVVEDGGTAVLNADSDVYGIFKHAAENRGLKIIGYGRSGGEICLKSVRSHGSGQQVDVEIYGKAYSLELAVAGEFQAMNILCAVGIVVACGASAEAAIEGLANIESVPGRMEQVVNLPSGASVYVDFAHTPNALETVLTSLRPHVAGKIHAVIGCGGDRDKGKRPQMGKIAATLADSVYVTDDNPRTETPADIRKDIMAGCPHATEVGDRKCAIEMAMKAANVGDVVLIAGKGHESGQIIGDKVMPFNDKDVAREIAVQLEGRDG